VAGDFNNWLPDATPMQRTTSGVWTAQLKLTPGRHQYRFVVDSQWLPDPKATMSAPNPHGGTNSVVIV
jgi:1,4-alpha-glucan branching enzyme